MEIATGTRSGEGTKPVPLTAYQKAKYFASRMRKLRREFVSRRRACQKRGRAFSHRREKRGTDL